MAQLELAARHHRRVLRHVQKATELAPELVGAYLDVYRSACEAMHNDDEYERFLRHSRTLGYRSVLIVHGRGLGSQGQEPVLKKAVVGWLSKKSFRSRVLGFCTARPVDGGAGALYVLLTRWRG